MTDDRRNVNFTVPAIPVAQPRQKHAFIAGKLRNYTPRDHPVNAYKSLCRISAAQHWSGPPTDSPVAVHVTFVMPRPKSMMWKTRPMPRVWHAVKPDSENMIKSSLDALTGLIWRDDSQVVVLAAYKVIASGDEQPCVEMAIQEL